MQAAADRLFGDVEQIGRLLGIVSGLRAKLGRANAERGISILLEQKAALEGRIAFYAQPVSTAKERRESAGSGCSEAVIGRKRRTDDNAREASMLGASRGNGTWARNFIAIRIVPILACEFMPDAEIHDAANLVRRGARFGALAMATGCLTGDWEDLRVRLRALDTLRAEPVGPPSETLPAADPERVLLHGAADELMRLSNPLLVSVGGRRLDLPFLRYRCMAAGIPLPALHTSLNGRL